MELESQEKSSSTKVGTTVLALLVLVAVVLSYFLYQNVNNSDISSTQDTTAPQATQPQHTATGSALSADEQAVLKPPASTATPEARAAHFAVVQKIAVDTTTLAIGAACKVSPVVLKTKMGTQLTFKNTDSAPHTITFSAKLSFPVPANQSITVPATFGKIVGIYGYNCDQKGLSGMVWVNQ